MSSAIFAQGCCADVCRGGWSPGRRSGAMTVVVPGEEGEEVAPSLGWRRPRRARRRTAGPCPASCTCQRWGRTSRKRYARGRPRRCRPSPSRWISPPGRRRRPWRGGARRRGAGRCRGRRGRWRGALEGQPAAARWCRSPPRGCRARSARARAGGVVGACSRSRCRRGDVGAAVGRRGEGGVMPRARAGGRASIAAGARGRGGCRRRRGAREAPLVGTRERVGHSRSSAPLAPEAMRATWSRRA